MSDTADFCSTVRLPGPLLIMREAFKIALAEASTECICFQGLGLEFWSEEKFFR